jgi:hypothetical protein
MRPDPGPFDADWSVTRTAVENLGPWRAIWQAHREPDAFARRCASDAIDAIDTALAALHRIRAEWVTQIRRADDQSAARADALLARMRDGPLGLPCQVPGDRRRELQTSPRSQDSTASVDRGEDEDRAPGGP